MWYLVWCENKKIASLQRKIKLNNKEYKQIIFTFLNKIRIWLITRTKKSFIFSNDINMKICDIKIIIQKLYLHN